MVAEAEEFSDDDKEVDDRLNLRNKLKLYQCTLKNNLHDIE